MNKKNIRTLALDILSVCLEKQWQRGGIQCLLFGEVDVIYGEVYTGRMSGYTKKQYSCSTYTGI